MLQGNFFFLLNNWNTMMKQRIIIGFLCICLASMAFAQERIRAEYYLPFVIFSISEV